MSEQHIPSVEHVCAPCQRPVKCDGIDYSHEGIEALRMEIIAARNKALMDLDFNAGVVLTHVVAMLSYLLEWQDWEGVL